MRASPEGLRYPAGHWVVGDQVWAGPCSRNQRQETSGGPWSGCADGRAVGSRLDEEARDGLRGESEEAHSLAHCDREKAVARL